MPDYSNPDFGTNLKTIKKDTDYLGRDFADIRTNLIEFAKAHFPKTYNDFNETSPGMMFIEMAAYVGDLMNYYIDNQFRETLLLQAEERKNIFEEWRIELIDNSTMILREYNASIDVMMNHIYKRIY